MGGESLAQAGKIRCSVLHKSEKCWLGSAPSWFRKVTWWRSRRQVVVAGAKAPELDDLEGRAFVEETGALACQWGRWRVEMSRHTKFSNNPFAEQAHRLPERKRLLPHREKPLPRKTKRKRSQDPPEPHEP